MFQRVKAWAWDTETTEDGSFSATTVAALKHLVRILFIVAYGYEKNKLSLRASALTYTVILSLIPLLAMSTAVLKGLGADDQMKAMVYRMIDQLSQQISDQKGQKKEDWKISPSSSGSRENRYEPEVVPKPDNLDTDDPISSGTAMDETLEHDSKPDSDSDLQQQEIRNDGEGSVEHLRIAVDKIFAYVEKTNFAALGWFGILGIIYSVIMLMSHIEESLNVIWKTHEARDIGRKIIDYIALIILMPVSINAAFWTMAALEHQGLITSLAAMFKVSWILPLLFKFLPAALVVGTFTILYRFMPNTNVKVMPATVGGIVGGLGWILMQTLYVKLQIGVAKYNAIYGSFATLPLFIFWLYLSWLVFLIGAQTSYAVQNHKCINLFERWWPPALMLALALDLMKALFQAHINGKTVTLEELSQQVKRPMDKVKDTLDILIRNDLAAEVKEDRGFLPLISERKLKNSKVLTAIIGDITEPDTPGLCLSKNAIDAAKREIDSERL